MNYRNLTKINLQFNENKCLKFNKNKSLCSKEFNWKIQIFI